MAYIIDQYTEYQRRGLVTKAKNLIQNIDYVLLCEEISDIWKYSTYEKLRFKDAIISASDDFQIEDIITVAYFILENKDHFGEDIANIVREADTIVVVDSDDDEFQAWPSEEEPQAGPSHGNRDDIMREILLCDICTQSKITSTLIPCGHTYCEPCAKKAKSKKKCFYCRRKVRSVQNMIIRT